MSIKVVKRCCREIGKNGHIGLKLIEMILLKCLMTKFLIFSFLIVLQD